MLKPSGLITPGQIKFLKLGTWARSSMPQKSSRAHWLFQSLFVHRPYILGSIRELNTNCKMYKDKMFSGNANQNPFTHLSSTGCLNPHNGQSQSLPTWVLWETYFLPAEVLKTIFLSWAWACLCILRYWTGARTVTSVLLQVTFNQDYTLLLWQTSLAWAKKVVPTSLLIVPGFIFMVCTGIRVLMNFTFYYSKALSRTHKPSKCYISPWTLKDTGTVVQSTHSSWPSEQLGSWLVAAAQGRPYTTWN